MNVSAMLDFGEDTIQSAYRSFKQLSPWERFNYLRVGAILGCCLVVFLVFGVDLVMAEQSGEISPQSIYEVQQYEELKSTKADVELIKQRLAEIEVDQQKRLDADAAWRQEMRDRMTRVETVGSVAVIGIGLLNTLGFLRKPKGEKSEES